MIRPKLSTALTVVPSNDHSRCGWYYDMSVYPPRLMIPEQPIVEDCADGSPQKVWGSLMVSAKARQHFATCPKCRLWDELENRW